MKAKKEERREDKRENRRARRLAARASRYSCKAAIHLLLMWCPSVLSNLSCSPQRILMARATLGRYLPRHLVTLSGGGHASQLRGLSRGLPARRRRRRLPSLAPSRRGSVRVQFPALVCFPFSPLSAFSFLMSMILPPFYHTTT